jgi:hypothetical protein
MLRKILFLSVWIPIFGVIIAAYYPVSRAWVGFANDPRIIQIDVKNTWYAIDGMSDIGFPISANDFLVDPQNKGVIPIRSGPHLVSIYANFTKLLGANNIAYEFCFSINEICIPSFAKTTINSAGTYSDSSATIELDVTPGLVYGAMIRNTTNTDNATFESALFKMERIK